MSIHAFFVCFSRRQLLGDALETVAKDNTCARAFAAKVDASAPSNGTHSPSIEGMSTFASSTPLFAPARASWRAPPLRPRARTNAYILSPSHRVIVTHRDVLLHLVRAHAHRTLHVREHGELFLAREPVAFEGGVIDVDRHLESVLGVVCRAKSARSRYVVRGACACGDEFVDRRKRVMQWRPRARSMRRRHGAWAPRGVAGGVITRTIDTCCTLFYIYIIAYVRDASRVERFAKRRVRQHDSYCNRN